MYLMNKNDIVAQFELVGKYISSEKVKVINPNLFPLGVDAEHLKYWWLNNSIPAERDSIKRGLQLVGVDSIEDLKLLSHGLSLTNNYWIKNEDENLSWEKINFWDNPFSPEIGEALFNHKAVHSNMHEIGLSPEPTNGGTLKKRWIRIDNEYYLQKKGSGSSAEEVFNELLAHDIYKACGTPIADFNLYFDNGIPTCISKCLTNRNVELIHFTQINELLNPIPYPRETVYEHFCRTLDYLNINEVYKDYLQNRLAIAYILADKDMHFSNIAVLHNTTLDSYELCPAYDNGNSLYFDVSTIAINPDDDDIIARPFSDNSYGNWNEQKELINSYPALSSDKLLSALKNFVYLKIKYGESPEDRVLKQANACMKRAYNLQTYLESKNITIQPAHKITETQLEEAKAELKSLAKMIEKPDEIISDGVSNDHYTT